MNSANGIKAIFFDLDGTLRHSVPSGGDVFTDYVMTLGLQVNEEARLRAMRWEHLYWASSPDLRDDLLAHSVDTENFWIGYSRRRLIALGASPGWSVEIAPNVSKHMGEFYKPESIIPEDVVGARRAGLQPVLYDPLGIFPEPDCTTIKSFDELNSILKVI